MSYTLHLHYPEAAGGTYELWEPNTTTPVIGFADYAASMPISVGAQVLSALGRATTFVNELVEVVIKTTAGAEVDRWIEGGAAELVEVINSGWTGTKLNGGQGAGGRTAVDRALTSAFTSVGGQDFKYLSPTPGNERFLKDVLAERFFSLRDMPGASGDGPAGDGVTDDYVALRQWLDYLEGASFRTVGLIPKGIYSTSLSLIITTPGLHILGEGMDISVLFNRSGTHCLELNIAGEADTVLRSFGIDQVFTTGSPGPETSGLRITDGDGITCHDLRSDSHFEAFYADGSNDRIAFYRCLSNNSNADRLSAAFTLGLNVTCVDCVASAADGAGWVIFGPGSKMIRCNIRPTGGDPHVNGFVVIGDDNLVTQCRGDEAGYETVSSAANNTLTHCSLGGLFPHGVATGASSGPMNRHHINFVDPEFRSLFARDGHSGFENRMDVFKEFAQDFILINTDGDGIPDLTKGPFQVMRISLGTGIFFRVDPMPPTVTAGLIDGQEFWLVLNHIADGAATFAVIWDAQYEGDLFPPPGDLAENQLVLTKFRWRESSATWWALHHITYFVAGDWP